MKDKYLFGIALLWLATATLLQGQSYNVTVQSGGLQTFMGFGASQTTEYTDGNLPATVRDQMATAIYNGLHANILRLWLSSGDSVNVASMENQFFPTYVSSGAISNIMSKGVTTLLLAPANGDAPTTNLLAYTADIAQVVSDLKTQKGVIINVTGICNEPGSWPTQDMANGVADLRTALNNLEVTNVQIVAPESASADSSCDAFIDAMYNSASAWNAILGIASHSYNMAATANEASRTHGKQYWITEASADGNEQIEDGNQASTIAARFLNDMNHMVTDWVFFIGFEDAANITNATDDATTMMVYDEATGTIQALLKYYYFQQLMATFDYGAIFRSCTSSSEGDMVYTYGQKPRINAAAALNPDGTWGIGIQNDTGVPSYAPLALYYSAINTNVTVTVNELVGTGNKSFTLYHSMPGAHFINDGPVTMTNGTITVAVAAEELVCLRSVGAGPPAPSGLTALAVSNNQINLSWTDNATNETGINIQRKTGSLGTYATIETVAANTTVYYDTGLTQGTTYYYEVAATNALGSSAWSGAASATTSLPPNGQPQPVSDDFNGPSINSLLWTNQDLGGASRISFSTFSITSSNELSIAVPLGTTHDAYNSTLNTPRLMQPCTNQTWSVSAKFDSIPVLNGSAEGIMFENAAGTACMRFDAANCNGNVDEWQWNGYIAGSGSIAYANLYMTDFPTNAVGSLYFRVTDTNGVYTTYTSHDNTNWIQRVKMTNTTFTTGAMIGVYADTSGSDPAFTMLVDYFYNTAFPPGANTPPTMTITSLVNNPIYTNPNALVITWPTTPGGFTLESSDTLAVPNWSNVTNSVVVVGDSNTVTLPITGSAKFFRLH